jgi:hypothetical protein
MREGLTVAGYEISDAGTKGNAGLDWSRLVKTSKGRLYEE